jgi:Zn finger protein HypA/HybF involved in hydrogenase expression
MKLLCRCSKCKSLLTVDHATLSCPYCDGSVYMLKTIEDTEEPNKVTIVPESVLLPAYEKSNKQKK